MEKQIAKAVIRIVEIIYEEHNVGCDVSIDNGVIVIIYDELDTPELKYPPPQWCTKWNQFNYELQSKFKSRGVMMPFVCVSKQMINDE